MKFILLPGVDHDIRESTLFYNREQPGLGLSFFRQVKSTIRNISSFPQAWPKLGNKFRQCQLEGFPFSIVYHVEETRIVIWDRHSFLGHQCISTSMTYQSRISSTTYKGNY